MGSHHIEPMINVDIFFLIVSVGLLEYKAQLFARQTTKYLINTYLEYKAR